MIHIMQSTVLHTDSYMLQGYRRGCGFSMKPFYEDLEENMLFGPQYVE